MLHIIHSLIPFLIMRLRFAVVLILLNTLQLQLNAQHSYFNLNLDEGRSELNTNLLLKDSFLYSNVLSNVISNTQSRNTIYKISTITGEVIDSLQISIDSAIFIIRNLYENSKGELFAISEFKDTRTAQFCVLYSTINFDGQEVKHRVHCSDVERLTRNSYLSFNNTSLGIGIADKNGYGQFYLVEIDSAGEILNEQFYGSPGYQEAWSVAQLPDSGFVIAGSVRQGSEFKNDLMLVRTDKDGNQKWLRKYGGPNHDGDGNHVQVLKNGNILMATCRHAPSSTHYDSWFAIINPANGNIILEKYYEHEWNNCFFTKPIEMEDGSFVIGGYRGVVNEDSSRVIRYGSLTKILPNGNVIWDRLLYFNQQNDNRILGIASDNEGGFWGYGWTRTTTQDGWLIKLDSLGCPFPDCDSINVSTGEISTETGARLRSYPNPATQNAIIHYQFSKQVASPMLEIFDLHGKMITQLPLNGEAPQGDVWMDLSDWVPGMYVMRIVSQGRILTTGKMLKG